MRTGPSCCLNGPSHRFVLNVVNVLKFQRDCFVSSKYLEYLCAVILKFQSDEREETVDKGRDTSDASPVEPAQGGRHLSRDYGAHAGAETGADHAAHFPEDSEGQVFCFLTERGEGTAFPCRSVARVLYAYLYDRSEANVLWRFIHFFGVVLRQGGKAQ